MFVGDEVKFGKDCEGIVKFIGPIPNKNGIFVGCQLKKGGGKNNGKIKNIQYFTVTKFNSGRFTSIQNIKSSKQTKNSCQFTINDKIYCKTTKCNGIIRYIGIPQCFINKKLSSIYFGIELDKPKGNCNGTIKKISYFKCKNKFGIYCQINQIQQSKSKKKSIKSSTKSATVSDAVADVVTDIVTVPVADDVPVSEPFPSCLSLKELKELKDGDKIEHRQYDNNECGRYLPAYIKWTKHKKFAVVHYESSDWPPSDRYDFMCDIDRYCDRKRFFKYLSVSKRKSNKIKFVHLGHTVLINPTIILYKLNVFNKYEKLNKSYWKEGKVERIDYNSCQVQISFNLFSDRSDVWRYWSHIDDENEIYLGRNILPLYKPIKINEFGDNNCKSTQPINKTTYLNFFIDKMPLSFSFKDDHGMYSTSIYFDKYMHMDQYKCQIFNDKRVRYILSLNDIKPNDYNQLFILTISASFDTGGYLTDFKYIPFRDLTQMRPLNDYKYIANCAIERIFYLSMNKFNNFDKFTKTFDEYFSVKEVQCQIWHYGNNKSETINKNIHIKKTLNDLKQLISNDIKINMNNIAMYRFDFKDENVTRMKNMSCTLLKASKIKDTDKLDICGFMVLLVGKIKCH